MAYADYPTIPFMQTESNWKDDPNWATGVSQFNDLAKFTSSGRTSVFTEWNMVNNQTSKSCWGWAQCIMINIDTTSGKVIYNPYFYAAKHFGYYVKVNARAIKFTIHGLSNLTCAAFRNPNDDIIFNIGNANSSATSITAKIGDRIIVVTVPGNSFNTLQITGATSVKETEPQAHSHPVLASATIRNSMLYFMVPASLGVQNFDLTLTDMQGRTIWTAHAHGAGIPGKLKVFPIRPSSGRLHAGRYILKARIKNKDAAVAVVERKILAVN